MNNQERGRKFEEEFAKRTGGKLVVASGSKWYAKLDVRAGKLIVSCKSTKHASFSIMTGMFEEIQDAISGVGGLGDDTIGVLAIEMQSNAGPTRIVAMLEEDWLALVKGEVDPRMIAHQQAEVKRARAQIPQLLREEPC